MYQKILRNELINDKDIGVIASTPNHVTKKMLSKVDFDNAKVIVEYGSGKAIITKQILSLMSEDAILYVFETKEQLVNDISKINDKRLIIINSDAEKAQIVLNEKYKMEDVDYIISTLPLTFIDRRKRRRIIFRSYTLLKEKGKFITYQYSWIIYHLVKKRFSTSSIKVKLFNIPPAFIIEGIK